MAAGTSAQHRQGCPRIYMPVCAVRRGGAVENEAAPEYKTFGNMCTFLSHNANNPNDGKKIKKLNRN